MILLKIAVIFMGVVFVFSLVAYMAIAIIASKIINDDHFPWE